MDLCLPAGGDDFILAGIRLGQTQIIANGAVEEMGLLGDDGDHPAHILCPVIMQLTAVQANPPLLIIPKAHQQVDQRRFTGAAGAHDSHALSWSNAEAYVVEHPWQLGRITEREVVNFQAKVRRRSSGLWRILHRRRGVNQPVASGRATPVSSKKISSATASQTLNMPNMLQAKAVTRTATSGGTITLT